MYARLEVEGGKIKKFVSQFLLEKVFKFVDLHVTVIYHRI